MAAHPLQVHPHFNAEEAAIAASEFVQSLDNLPGEVAFLLAEIRDKDERISQLVNRTNQRHYALTKSVKNITPTTAPANASFPLPIPPGAPIPSAHLSTKDAQNISKIQGEWVKIQQLQDDKVALAERLERIVARARERGRAEWRRVGGMDFDDEDLDIKVPTPEAIPIPTTKRGKKGAGTPLAAQISAGLGTLSGANSPARQGSMPPPPVPRSGAGSRAGSRGRGRGHSLAMSVEPEPEPEIEMEVDIIDGTEVEADDQLYCFCQQKSFGEMIGCDNDKCKYEWFHIKCVNLTTPLPETWYCPECVKTLGLMSSDGKRERKGRKK